MDGTRMVFSEEEDEALRKFIAAPGWVAQNQNKTPVPQIPQLMLFPLPHSALPPLPTFPTPEAIKSKGSVKI